MNLNLKKAIKYGEPFPEAHFYLGMYYIETGDLKKANKEFDFCLETAKEKWEDERKDKWTREAEKMKKHCSFLNDTIISPHYLR